MRRERRQVQAQRCSPNGLTARIAVNEKGGRDFVAGDVHGELDTLDKTLEMLEFDPRRDRLFAVGDLIDRGPRSADALEWMERGKITLSVRGNHEQMLDDRVRLAEDAYERPPTWSMHPWFPKEVARAAWGRWRAMIAAMPLAATVETGHGRVGLIHAGTKSHSWAETLRKLDAGDGDTIAAALWSSARARGDRQAAALEGVAFEGPIEGVRAVITGHTGVQAVKTTANVWHIDTGAGFARGRLTVARSRTDE